MSTSAVIADGIAQHISVVANSACGVLMAETRPDYSCSRWLNPSEARKLAHALLVAAARVEEMACATT